MKMIVITAIQMFEEDIVKMLKQNNVNAFSSTELVGYANKKSTTSADNWFGGGNGHKQSMLFFAFVPEESVDAVFHAVEEFNGKQKTESRIHLAVLHVEKSN
jgi:hypothetical protein